MMNDAIEVEINLTAAREKGREEGEIRKNGDLTHPSPSNAPKAKTDMMMEAMERLMESLIVDHNSHPIINQDFRGPLCI